MPLTFSRVSGHREPSTLCLSAPRCLGLGTRTQCVDQMYTRPKTTIRPKTPVTCHNKPTCPDVPWGSKQHPGLGSTLPPPPSFSGLDFCIAPEGPRSGHHMQRKEGKETITCVVCCGSQVNWADLATFQSWLLTPIFTDEETKL